MWKFVILQGSRDEARRKEPLAKKCSTESSAMERNRVWMGRRGQHDGLTRSACMPKLDCKRAPPRFTLRRYLAAHGLALTTLFFYSSPRRRTLNARPFPQLRMTRRVSSMSQTCFSQLQLAGVRRHNRAFAQTARPIVFAGRLGDDITVV